MDLQHGGVGDLSHGLRKNLTITSRETKPEKEKKSIANLSTDDASQSKDHSTDNKGKKVLSFEEILAQQSTSRPVWAPHSNYLVDSTPFYSRNLPKKPFNPFPVKIHTPVGSPTGNMERPGHHPKPRLLLMGQRRYVTISVG